MKECDIYFLVGEDEGVPSVYVCQANFRNNEKGVLGRVIEHDKESDSYWETALLLYSTSNGQYPIELNYLERSFWNKAKMGSFKVTNVSKPALGNYAARTEIAMDKFIASANMIIRIQGYRFLYEKQQTGSPFTTGSTQFFIIRKGKGLGCDIEAVCEIRDGKSAVLQGSLVATVPRNSNDQKDYGHIRCADLIDQMGRLKHDMAFDKFPVPPLSSSMDYQMEMWIGKIQKENLSSTISSDHMQG